MTKIAFFIRKLGLLLAVLSAILLPVLYSAPAHAQISHSWVSHGGNDNNNCLETSPCATFTRALAVLVAGYLFDGGEVSCLDSGSFGTFTVTQSVIIDCKGVMATANTDFPYVCGTSIIINAPGAVVTLRNLDVTSTAFSFNLVVGCNTDGILIEAAAAVNIENCTIEHNTERGIDDTRTTGSTKLSVKNTVVRNNTSTGIALAAAAKNSVVLENVHSVGNAYGVAAATGNIVLVSRSVMSENGTGVYADSGASVFVDNTEISHNTTAGIQANGTVVIGNSDISFNTSSISGATTSYGNNRIFGNGTGTTPTMAAQQ